jgi:hypothetical protein
MFLLTDQYYPAVQNETERKKVAANESGLQTGGGNYSCCIIKTGLIWKK